MEVNLRVSAGFISDDNSTVHTIPWFMLVSAHYSLTFLAGLQKEQATRTNITQRKNVDFIFVGWNWVMKTVALAQNVSAD